jgi:inorganic pyrophosphatase
MNLLELPTRDDDGNLRAVVETPCGSLAKIKYDAKLGFFELARTLVEGVVYPHDWGFVPSTKAPDGDPLDVMILHAAKTYPGVVIRCRPIAIVKLSQKRKQGRGRERNDRLIAVPAREERFSDRSSLSKRRKEELEQFFLNAVLLQKKEVRIQGWGGPEDAEKIIAEAEKSYTKR